VTIDLAFDPRAAFKPQAQGAIVIAESGAVTVRRSSVPSSRDSSSKALDPTLYDVDADARLLAEYGPAPTSWAGMALYWWRVVKRGRELKLALAVRRGEAARARAEVEDALLAFAERVRPSAEGQPSYGDAFQQLRRAEEVLRSRDRHLAAEHDAHSARLASVGAQIAKLEADKDSALAAERSAAAELAAAQTDLGREEAQLKRAEGELRAIQQREAVRARE
jgi:hypothetical protein